MYTPVTVDEVVKLPEVAPLSPAPWDTCVMKLPLWSNTRRLEYWLPVVCVVEAFDMFCRHARVYSVFGRAEIV
jgi:hypothetical protein